MQTLITKLCPELNIKNESSLPPLAENFNEQMEVICAEKVPIFSFTLSGSIS